MTRYIFVTGGVTSSLGKGLAAASLAALLQARGYTVRLRKFEPYINVDPGTMSPFQHGEVYVTEDGAETDLDLGHYERFTGVDSHRSDAVSTGQIYSEVISRERRGDYLGGTVQVIPHITDMIQECITRDIDHDTDFVLIEIGGTVGDIEGLPFLEAIRQFVNNVGSSHALYMHLTLLPYIASAGELKTKPTQHSVKELLHVGIQPNILLCRSEQSIPETAKHKLALFCNIKPECVIEALDVDNIYEVPLRYSEAGLDRQVLKHFNLPIDSAITLDRWININHQMTNVKGQAVQIAVIGKYTGLKDAYKSLAEALIHGGIANGVNVTVHWLDAENLEDHDQTADASRKGERLNGFHGILVPGGYGKRGTEGMLKAINYARENNIPYLGICLGMQLAIIEAARNLLGLNDANSTELAETQHPVVGLLTEWRQGDKVEHRNESSAKGGTMRLGAYECRLRQGSKVQQIYAQNIISERHRHRYEVNMNYREPLEAAGLLFTGMSPDERLPEMVEYKDHPWFIGTQAHPELKSRPFQPHPLFVSFITAAQDYAAKMIQK